jgi:hypothetical protein
MQLIGTGVGQPTIMLEQFGRYNDALEMKGRQLSIGVRWGTAWLGLALDNDVSFWEIIILLKTKELNLFNFAFALSFENDCAAILNHYTNTKTDKQKQVCTF